MHYEVKTVTHYNIETSKNVIMLVVKFYSTVTELKSTVKTVTTIEKRIEVGYEETVSTITTISKELIP